MGGGFGSRHFFSSCSYCFLGLGLPEIYKAFYLLAAEKPSFKLSVADYKELTRDDATRKWSFSHGVVNSLDCSKCKR